MTHDDELRQRMNRLADETEVSPVTLESVEARGRRRTQRQRIVAVAAAFLFVAGAAFGLNALTGQQGDTDVASPVGDDAEASTSDADDTADDDAAADDAARDTTLSTTTTMPVGDEMAETATAEYDHAYDSAYYGPNQVVPWKGGFLAWGQRFVPSEVTMADLVPDIGDRFPPEIVEALRAAGIGEGDPYTIDEAMQIIEAAGLMEVAEETVLADPELLDAFNEVSAGGTHVPFVELSTDGVTWEPVEIGLLLGENGWPQLASNGDALIVAVQNNTWDPETGRTIDQSLTVHTTTDLQTWHSHELEIDVPDASPYASIEAYPSSVAAGPDSWYVSVSVHSWIDVWSALPADVIDEMNRNNWGWEHRDEGIAIVSYPDEPIYGEEPQEDWTDEDWAAWEEGWQPTVERIVPWTDLPFSQDELYGTERGESFGYVGDYAGNISQAGTPPIETFDCCQVTATEAGFLTVVWDYVEYDNSYPYPVVVPEVEAAYPVTGGDDVAGDDIGDAVESYYAGPDVSLWFSPDGQLWSPRDLPDGQWFDNLAAVQGGVLLLGSNDDGQSMFLGSPDGRGWEPVDGPDLGDDRYLWFQTHGTDGVATVIDVADHAYHEFVAYNAEFSVDGKDISLSVSDTGAQTLVVSENGEVLIEKSAQLWHNEVWHYGDDGYEIRDDDGNVIVMIGWDTVEQEVYEAESRAWQQREIEDPYVPEFVLVASVDGRTWFQQALPSEPNHWYEGAAISNGIVTVRTPDQWQTYTIN